MTPPAAAPGCEWALDEPDSGTWATDCGHMFTILAGTPTENRMAFCCYCGKPLKAPETG